jgi:hypothetical protein
MEELPVLEEDRVVKAIRFGCEAGRGPGLSQRLNDSVAPDSRAEVILDLEVGVQARDDGVCYTEISSRISRFCEDNM